MHKFVIGFPERGGPRADVGEYGDFIKNLSPSGGGNVGTLLLMNGEKIGNKFLFLNH